jgi:flagellar hook protein FlgE
MTAAINAMRAGQQDYNTIAENIGAQKVDGYKRAVFRYFVQPRSSEKSGGLVSGKVISEISRAGAVRTTGSALDLRIDGSGFLPVRDAVTNALRFIRTADFSKDKLGNLVSSSGFILTGWLFDADGNLPAATASQSSLTSLNLSDLVSEPVPTNEVEYNVFLNSEEAQASNGSVTIDLLKGVASDANVNASDEDLLFTHTTNGIQASTDINPRGLKLVVKEATQQGQAQAAVEHLIYYGGFARIADSGAATMTTAINAINATPTFSVTVTAPSGTITHNIAFTLGANDLATLRNIATAVNALTLTPSLRARVDSDNGTNYLMIAPEDANYSMEFGDYTGNVGIIDAMGLSTSNTSRATNRFASLSDLASRINEKAGANAKAVSGSRSFSATSGTRYENGFLTITASNNSAISLFDQNGSGKFLTEFGVEEGFIAPDYNPADSGRNMAGSLALESRNRPHFQRDFIIYDNQGIAHEAFVGFLKIGTNRWATEVFIKNPIDADGVLVVNGGRPDGLIQAGVITFDENGNLEGFEQAQGASYGTVDIADPEVDIRALGNIAFNDSLDVSLGGVAGPSFVYGRGTQCTFMDPAGTAMVDDAVGVGTPKAADELTVTVGGAAIRDINNNLITVTRGAGVTDGDVLENLRDQINMSAGTNAARAEVITNSAGNVALRIWAVDKDNTLALGNNTVVGPPAGLDILNGAAQLIMTANVAANADDLRFNTPLELQEAINTYNSGTSYTGTLLRRQFSPSIWEFKFQSVTPGEVTFSGAVNDIFNFSTIETGMFNLEADMQISWNNRTLGTGLSTISNDWGTVGTANGISQTAGVSSIRENGVSANGNARGLMDRVTIDNKGILTAFFSNGTSRDIAQIPVAVFNNPDGLKRERNTSYVESSESGQFNLQEAGVNGAGSIAAETIEQSNVDVIEELTNMATTLRFTQANAKSYKVSDQMTEEAINMVRV